MSVGTAGVPLREVALVLLTGVIVSYLVTGLVRYVMLLTGRVAEIRSRDVHTQPTPQLGGVAMLVGFLAAVAVAAQLPALTRGFLPITPEMRAVVLAAVIIVAVGVVDDLYELGPLTKLVGQVAAALVMTLLGLAWTLLYVPVGEGTTVVLDSAQSSILTVLFTVLLVNAFNFVDGLDGLAAGLGAISGGAILLFSLTVLYDQGGAVQAYPPAIMSAALVGICVGFLPHNFEPARIFMGDSGSMLIGLLLAAAATSASGKISMSLYGGADVVALLSPFIVVGAAIAVPMLDLVLAVVRRLRRGVSPFAADRLHLHHRLLALGHTHRHTALVLYFWGSAVTFGAVSFSVVPAPVAAAFTIAALIGAFLATFIPLRLARHGQR